jgi:mono/diheme cytochrome c family protein
MHHTRRIISGIVILACATLAAQQSPQSRSSASGVYTAVQASTGEKIYFEKCATCPGADLGGIERAPALAGSLFIQSWQGRDRGRSRDRIDTMPPTAPKSLADADTAAARSCWPTRCRNAREVI